MKRYGYVFALAFMLGILCAPQKAMGAALGALALWYHSVLPALFPFMALMPALTSPQARRAYDKLLGFAMRPLFGLPGGCACAVAVGMLSGSPTGCLAAAEVAAQEKLSHRQTLTLCALCSGLSPVFLVCGAGGLLKDTSAGFLLLRAQIISQMMSAAVVRFLPWRSDLPPAQPVLRGENSRPVREAVLRCAEVGGYMLLFAVAARLISAALGEKIGSAALFVCDAPSGLALAAGADLPKDGKILCMALLTGWNGACIIAQNMSFLGNAGVRMWEFFAIKCMGAGFCAAAAWLQLAFFGEKTADFVRKSVDFFPVHAVSAVFCLAPIVILCVKNVSLTPNKHLKRREVAP